MSTIGYVLAYLGTGLAIVIALAFLTFAIWDHLLDTPQVDPLEHAEFASVVQLYPTRGRQVAATTKNAPGAGPTRPEGTTHGDHREHTHRA